ncbi:MAG TPA: UbiD family decarboxylase [Phycisphaerales bacterium]|nr:UbiD family decarboxylase [Phycisphaerales bacterium]
MHPDLRTFLRTLAAAGELRTVSARVDAVLEVTAITDRVSKSPAPHIPSASAIRNDPRFHHLGGDALVFQNVAGSEYPLAINVYGSYRRTEIALGCNEAGAGLPAGRTPGGFDALAAKMGDLVKPAPPRSLREALAALRKFAPLLRIPPRRSRGRGVCQEVVLRDDHIDLTRLPIIRCWPHDGDFATLGFPAGVNDGVPGAEHGEAWDRGFRGRYITFGGIHTVHADDAEENNPASHNIGMYRVQLLGRRTMAMHWHMHHDGARHWRSWKQRGRPMPVAIALGGESVLPYAATAPLPPGISELLLAGYLNGRGVEMVRGVTVPLWVPANAEFVIEGYVSHEAGSPGWDPRSGEPLGPGAVFEGPFGDHTGFYSLPDRYPLLTVTAITHRREPVFPATVVGLPPQEDYYLGKATERLFLPLLRTLIPDVEDYDLPMFGAFHNCAFLKVKKEYPLQARRLMHAVWGAGQMAWTKTVVVVDQDVDVHDPHAVLSAAAARCEVPRDLEVVNGPLDILDHAAPRLASGTKLGLDATRKRAGDDVDGRPLAGEPRPASPAEIAAVVDAAKNAPGVTGAFCEAGWLLVTIRKSAAGDGRRAIGVLARSLGELGAYPRFVVVLGEGVALQPGADEALFHWLANGDAGRDMTVIGGRAYFDGTPKLPGDDSNGQAVRQFPPVLAFDDATRTLVERRWTEYGFGAPSA